MPFEGEDRQERKEQLHTTKPAVPKVSTSGLQACGMHRLREQSAMKRPCFRWVGSLHMHVFVCYHRGSCDRRRCRSL